MDVRSADLWLLLWLSVTGSFELWQPKLKFFMPMDCDALVCVACRPEAIAWTFPHCWFHNYCPGVYVVFFPPYFYDLWHDYIFHFLSFPILHIIFGMECWVWGSVVQLVCVLYSSPGSDYGFFFPLVCC